MSRWPDSDKLSNSHSEHMAADMRHSAHACGLRARALSPSNRSSQRGAALLVFLTIIVLAAASVLIERLQQAARDQSASNERTVAALSETKAALIGWAVGHPTVPGMMPWPDRNADLEGYDGRSDCEDEDPFEPGFLLGRIPW